MIDKVIEKAYDTILLYFRQNVFIMKWQREWILFKSRHEKSKIKNEKKKWKEKTKKIQYRKLTSKINHRHLNIYVERSKTHNALIIQLKTNKIKFNKFCTKNAYSTFWLCIVRITKNTWLLNMYCFSVRIKKKRRKMLQRKKIINIK